ncbi:hypothetical protein [Fodinicola feengrottensis]|uniref:hypothetical protein n=1 Tax=Fodinicola feengrottensis TaxID=435914 RepID=UPI0036F21D41
MKISGTASDGPAARSARKAAVPTARQSTGADRRNSSAIPMIASVTSMNCTGRIFGNSGGELYARQGEEHSATGHAGHRDQRVAAVEQRGYLHVPITPLLLGSCLRPSAGSRSVKGCTPGSAVTPTRSTVLGGTLEA